jgi:hypothetical protein
LLCAFVCIILFWNALNATIPVIFHQYINLQEMKNHFIILLLFLLSCNKDSLNPPFEPIAKETMYDSMQPKESYDYFEIREYSCYDSINYGIVYSNGNKISSDTSIIINREESINMGNMCKSYIILARKNSEYYEYTTYNGIKDFIGNIDSKGDALFLVTLNGYYFRYNDQKSGIRCNGSTYQIYAFKLIKTCAPTQTDLFLLEINSLGNIKILMRKVYSKYQYCGV